MQVRFLILVPLALILLISALYEKGSQRSPSAIPTATPYPTPTYDPESYLPKIKQGKTVTVAGENLADKIQTAQNDPTVVIVKIEGGGSISKQVTLRKYTIFDSSTYSCDTHGITDQGQFLIADGVRVEGTWRLPKTLLDYYKLGNGRNWKDPYLQRVQALTADQLAGTGTTILEPTFVNGPYPAIAVFQALGDTIGSHTGSARNIAVIGFHIKGRQKIYDGGVRSTIQLGNCVRCTAQNNYLEDTGSIGISLGGSALEKNYYSDQSLIWHNVASGVAAANFAAVNSENLLVIENYSRRPGHHEPRFGGGVCGFDLETNSGADHSKNIQVFNNLFDYEEAAREATGNALCLQDPYLGANHGLVIAGNNIAIGGRGERSDHRYMSNGIFLVGLKQCKILNNYVFRTGQNAIQAYNLDGCLIQDNDFESTGGGGNSTVFLTGVRNTTFRRNNFRSRPGLNINVQSGMVDKCGKGNVFENNLTNGKLIPQAPPICP
ncbi:MAG TPA: right-handed parallel beta-helix repeat-containing protein [Pyrinomonadaceae bacterium]|nr:right-handed parallel beta-helix repeat-containing protein [Pyrinomonadaceae bacterium]